MKVTDHVTPENIEELFDDIIINLGKQHAVEDKLKKQQIHLDSLKASIFNSPGFVAAKNMAIEEGKFRELFPDTYFMIETDELELKELKDTAEKLAVTKQEYAMIISLFTVIENSDTPLYKLDGNEITKIK